MTAANSGGKGMNFPLKQTTSAGPIDLQAVVDKSAQGLNVDEQKKNVTAARWPSTSCSRSCRCGSATVTTRRWRNAGAKFPADDDPILKNAPYADNFVIMYMYQGKVAPV